MCPLDAPSPGSPESNFEKRFSAIDSGEPGEDASRGHIIQKNFENFFYGPLSWEHAKTFQSYG